MLFKGMMIGGGLIVAIGAQNAFVLTQGLKREYNFAIAITCIICDVLFIALGVGGLGTLVASSPLIADIAGIGGGLFLIFYGFNSLISALIGKRIETSKEKIGTLRKAVLMTLAFTLLNPHFYLDTLVLMGSISSQFNHSERMLFGLGAMVASAIWFLGLSYGSRMLLPLFKKAVSWRILDLTICGVMWYLAYFLLVPYI